LARQVAKHNVTINGLLPGRFLTERLQQNLNFTAKQSGIALDEEIDRAQKLIRAERFGRPDEFGALCAFVCSEHAGFITGQNLLLDGGAFPGLV
jgi:3-oxoacyl-[acyl-carrier protein] reductase